MSNRSDSLVILLAEDNSDHAELIIEAFNSFDDDNIIYHVCNGEEALQYLDAAFSFAGSRPVPDLIILDLKMHRLDGKNTLKSIRANPRTKHIPVIIISTSSADIDVNDCYQLGANSYISKSIDFDAFIKKMASLNEYWARISEIPR